MVELIQVNRFSLPLTLIYYLPFRRQQFKTISPSSDINAHQDKNGKYQGPGSLKDG